MLLNWGHLKLVFMTVTNQEVGTECGLREGVFFSLKFLVIVFFLKDETWSEDNNWAVVDVKTSTLLCGIVRQVY